MDPKRGSSKSTNLSGQMSALSINRQGANSFPKEIQDALKMLAEHGKKLKNIQCMKCKKSILKDFNLMEQMKKFFDRSTTGTVVITSVRCTGCSTSHCLGCGKPPSSSKNTAQVKSMKMGWCCDDGRTAAIWILLCYFDGLKVVDKRAEDHKQAHKQPSKAAGTGVGYTQNVQAVSMDPFAAHRNVLEGTSLHATSGFVEFKTADRTADKQNENIMLLLEELLPKLVTDKSPAFEKSPPAVIAAMFKLSFVTEMIVDLLRNDSLADAATRMGIYRGALKLTETLVARSVTRPLVIDERYVKKRSGGLLMLTGGGESLELGPEKEGKNMPIAKVMKQINLVATIMRGGAKLAPADFKDESDLDYLCRKVMQVADKVKAHAKSSSATSAVSRDFKTYHQQNMVTWIDDRKMEEVNIYGEEAMQPMPVRKGRMKRLVEEIAELSTALPEGIFVKTADTRPDLMKVLIQGPSDTPYEFGLFEFDVWCPHDYPLRPPRVWFPMATKHYKGINPNIHPDGKVCLSLLGTWPGEPSEQWQPMQSKVISVFVSIQSMIFNDNPNANHPISALGAMDPNSANQDVEAATVAFGMLPWLQNRNLKNGIWSEVVERYFKHNASKIMAVVEKWSRTNPYLRHGYDDPAVSRYFHQSQLMLVQSLSTSLGPYLKR